MFFLLQNWRTGGWNRFRGWGICTSGLGGHGREKGRRMNMVQTVCTHVCKCKTDTCLNCSRNQWRGVGEEKWRGEFKYDIFDKLLEPL
jgi:hypothetical protein